MVTGPCSATFGPIVGGPGSPGLGLGAEGRSLDGDRALLSDLRTNRWRARLAGARSRSEPKAEASMVTGPCSATFGPIVGGPGSPGPGRGAEGRSPDGDRALLSDLRTNRWRARLAGARSRSRRPKPRW